MTGLRRRGRLTLGRELTLSDEGLTCVQQDVAALHDHPLYGQILPDVLGVTHFVVHHPANQSLSSTPSPIYRHGSMTMCTHSLRQLLQFGFGKLQTLALHVLMRCVCQQLMESDDVSWNLKKNTHTNNIGDTFGFLDSGGCLTCAHATWNMG